MAMVSARSDAASVRSGRRRFLIGMAAVLLLLVVAVIAAALAWSGVTLASDSRALARVTVQPLGGRIEHVEAFGPGGRRVPLAVSGGRLTPLRRLTPGEQVSVDVVVRRPGWLGWALGATRSEHLTLNAPVATVTEPWLTVGAGAPVRVSFDQPVSAVAYGSPGSLKSHSLSFPESSLSLGTQATTGTMEVAAAPRSWEKVGAPTLVSWFPPSHSPVLVALPASGTDIGPATRAPAGAGANRTATRWCSPRRGWAPRSAPRCTSSSPTRSL
jgi:hypothetical protein